MKKKVIIVSHNMDLGGIEKSLLGLLQSFDYDNYDVDLFLFSQSGGLLKYIPRDVSLLPEIKQYSHINKSFKECVLNNVYGIVLAKVFATVKYKFFTSVDKNKNNDAKLNYLYAYANFFTPKISSKEYDLAISFSDVHYSVINKVKAKKKICWIHTDYSVVNQDTKHCFNMWNAYDNIVAVSNECKNSFLNSYPSLSEKLIVIENQLSKEYVFNEANKNQNLSYASNAVTLLSVGRFATAKNYDNVPYILKRIRENSINAKWYIIGYGADEQLIRNNIINAGVQEHMILLGKQENPYPYIKNCDVYVQPSRYEGKSVTVREAQMLGKPVIITDYPTSSAQLNDGFDGLIVPMGNNACADAIVKVLEDKTLLEKLSANTMVIDYSNKTELVKLYSLI